jgi:hypothetical protein
MSSWGYDAAQNARALLLLVFRTARERRPAVSTMLNRAFFHAKNQCTQALLS